MKKALLGFVFGMALLLVVGVFATASENLPADINQDVEDVVKKVANPSEIADKTKEYVKEFVKKKGIQAEQVKNITEVNFEELPKEVNIEGVDNSNLAIYRVDYEENNKEEDKVFVITYSTNELKAQGDIIVAQDKRQFLNFGSAEKMRKSSFLKTATGVEGSLEKGYIMMREGSITGISTNLDVIEDSANGRIEIIIYKNGEAISFSNMIEANSIETKKDYDIQSKDVVTFEAGDVISAYARGEGDVAWQDVITIVEITTTN